MMKYVVAALAGLMMMAPQVYANDAVPGTTTAPTGPQAEHETHVKKDMKHKRMAKGKRHNKKVKPLSHDEKKQMEQRLDATQRPAVQGDETSPPEVK